MRVYDVLAARRRWCHRGGRLLREERPEDWEMRWSMVALRDVPLFDALQGIALEGLRWGTLDRG